MRVFAASSALPRAPRYPRFRRLATPHAWRGKQTTQTVDGGRICPQLVIAAIDGSDHDVPVRRIVILAFEGAQTLDVTGPFEVFSIANRLSRGGEYAVEIVAPHSRRPIRTGSGVSIVPDRATGGVRGPLDTLLVAGGEGVLRAIEDDRLVRWVKRAAGRSRRVASVCTGAYLLARAGLLDGRRAATHWSSVADLARRHPEIDVDPEAIFVRDGEVWTSAGVTAGMDLALALVEEDLGRRVALETARWLVVFVQRPGGQSQFSSHLRAPGAERQPPREPQGRMAADPAARPSAAAA